MQNPADNTPKNTKETPLTAKELYQIDAKPIWLAQSPLQDDGTVIMKWKTINGVYYTKSRVF